MKLTASFQLFVIKATLDYLGKCVEAGPSEWFKARRVGPLQGVPPPPHTHTQLDLERGPQMREETTHCRVGRELWANGLVL